MSHIFLPAGEDESVAGLNNKVEQLEREKQSVGFTLLFFMRGLFRTIVT